MAQMRSIAAVILLTAVLPGSSQSPTTGKKPPPRLVPVAETKLLMEGLAHPNFQGVERVLKSDEADAESWTIARGQALLIAESANLLMLRPPKNSGQDAWMQHAAKMRDAATDLAHTVAKRDAVNGRIRLTSLGNQCNSCHQTFRVATRITVFAPANDRSKPGIP